MPLRNNRVILVGTILLCCLILLFVFLFFSNRLHITTSNPTIPPEKVMVSVAPPVGDSFREGIVFIAPNQSTILFTAQLQDIYQKDGKIIAHLLIAQNNQEVSLPFVFFPTSKNVFILQKQTSQTIFPSVKSKDIPIPFNTAISSLTYYHNRVLAFLAIVSLPGVKVSSPLDPYFTCNKSLLQLLNSKSDLHALTCQPLVSQAKVYVQSL